VHCLSLLSDYEQKIEARLFHVAFARLMEFTNTIQRAVLSESIHTVLYSHLLLALYPFAPHLCSEWYDEVWHEDLSQYRLQCNY